MTYKIKKYLPLLASILLLGGYLGFQVWSQQSKSHAQTEGTQPDPRFEYYEKLLSEFQSQSGIRFQGKNLIISFWASWCRPCLEEFASLNQLLEKHPPSLVQVIGVNTDDQDQEIFIKKFNIKYSLKFPSIADDKGKWVEKFKVLSIPFSVLYREGKVVEIFEKKTDFSKIIML